jgi:hypothetical protein
MNYLNFIYVLLFALIGYGMYQQGVYIEANSRAFFLLENRTTDIIDVVQDYVVMRNIAGSGSMKPLLMKDLYQDITTINRVLDEDEDLMPGKIYVYKREDYNGSVYVIHRLLGVYYIGNDTLYIFKGDNNLYVDEPVYREQIMEEAIRIDLY